MKAPCHCSRASSRRAVMHGAGWILPGALLLLMPKCPLCFAAVISVLFGIGLSAEASSFVYTSVIIICTVLIALAVIRQVSSMRRSRTDAAASSRSTQAS